MLDTLDADIQQRIAEELALLFDPPIAAARRPPVRRAPPPVMLDHPRIAKAVRLLERNPSTLVRLKDAAAHINLSPFHFQRLFQEVMGESPSGYLRRVLLSRAAMNLQMSDESVLQVALNAGYASHEAFIRAFQRQFGEVPSQYRLRSQGLTLPALEEDLQRLPRVQVAQEPHLPLLAMRFHGPQHRIEAHWQAFADYLRGLGLDLSTLQAFGVFYDSPLITPAELMRYDCAILDPGFEPSGTALTRLDLHAGRYVSLKHEGPYWQVLLVLRTLALAWLPQSGEMFAPAANGGYEQYLSPPWEAPGSVRRFRVVLPLHDFAQR
ncbi:AraC family transcriptional regulator [Pseudomonas cuatrocienegasensis]|uniref:AraC family transcriptional regulator n=1 Tax=Pseudomonas cuatrocienegasensis TaxID=543360 RepID=A0ABY1BJX7_9PSED|nr:MULTISPECIES: helix-turn-helix domain-containing protein [Pseudomonas]SER02344.1 AraC family transcriptional regulator [Pseudomonas cuatrocienegasensis]